MAERADKDIALNYMTEHEYEILHGEDHELPSLKVNPKPDIIRFQDVDGNLVGRLFVKDGKLDFEGDATEAAMVLFNGFKRHIEQQLMERKDAKKRSG